MAKEVNTSGLERELDDMRGAVRKMAQDVNNLLSSVAKLNEEQNNNKAEVANLKIDLKALQKQVVSATSYE